MFSQQSQPKKKRNRGPKWEEKQRLYKMKMKELKKERKEQIKAQTPEEREAQPKKTRNRGPKWDEKQRLYKMNKKQRKKEKKEEKLKAITPEEREEKRLKQEKAHQERVRKYKLRQQLRCRSKYGRGKRNKAKTKTKYTKEQLKVLTNCEDGLTMIETTEKGRSVFATKSFAPGDFLCEYTGDLITESEGRERETEIYNLDPVGYGSFMMYFVDKVTCKNMCVDATEEFEPLRLGRLVNHVSAGPNVERRQIRIDGKPHIILYAAKHIQEGEELLYTYGERRKHIINAGNEFLLPVSRGAGKTK